MPLSGGNGSSDCAAAFNRVGQIETAVADRVDGSCDAAALDTTEPWDVVELPGIAMSAEITALGDIVELDATKDVGTVLLVAGGLTR
jgi:hypothetical protein